MSSKFTAADEAARRTAIIEAARWCFLNFGYAKTSLEDIAKRAAISRTLLYRMFKNKEEIFAAVFEHVFEQTVPAAEAALAAPGTAAQRLMRALELMLLGPWAEMADAPMAGEFFEVCSTLAPEVEARYARRVLRIAQSVLGDKPTAEVFLLALDGLQADLPSVATLRKRVQLLVDRFAAFADSSHSR